MLVAFLAGCLATFVYNTINVRMIHSLTPPPSGLVNAFSKNILHILLLKMIASVVSLPGMKSNCMSLISELTVPPQGVGAVGTLNCWQKVERFRRKHGPETGITKLWRTIKGIDCKTTHQAGNEALTFNGTSLSTPKQLANIHTSSSQTRFVTRESQRAKPWRFGPDRLSIFYLEHVGPRAIEYIIAPLQPSKHVMFRLYGSHH